MIAMSTFRLFIIILTFRFTNHKSVNRDNKLKTKTEFSQSKLFTFSFVTHCDIRINSLSFICRVKFVASNEARMY